MTTSVTLGKHFESFVKEQLATGRYSTPREVVQDALRLMEDRERRLASLDLALQRGLSDLEAGRVHDLDEVCDALEAKYRRMAEATEQA